MNRQFAAPAGDVESRVAGTVGGRPFGDDRVGASQFDLPSKFGQIRSALFLPDTKLLSSIRKAWTAAHQFSAAGRL